MSSKTDLRALRVLPYLTGAIVVMAHLSAVVLCALAIRMVAFSDAKAYNFIGMFISYTTSFKHIVIIALFVCLYRLSSVTKWFYYSWLCCIIYIVAGLATQGLAWLTTVTNGNIAATALSFMLSLLPDASILFAVYSLLRGSESIYIDIDRMDGRREASRAGNLWIFVETALLSSYYLLFVICALARKIFQFKEGEAPLVLSIFSYAFTMLLAIAIVVYINAAWKVTRVVKDTCYDYYLYNYNSGVGV